MTWQGGRQMTCLYTSSDIEAAKSNINQNIINAKRALMGDEQVDYTLKELASAMLYLKDMILDVQYNLGLIYNDVQSIKSTVATIQTDVSYNRSSIDILKQNTAGLPAKLQEIQDTVNSKGDSVVDMVNTNTASTVGGSESNIRGDIDEVKTRVNDLIGMTVAFEASAGLQFASILGAISGVAIALVAVDGALVPIAAGVAETTLSVNSIELSLGGVHSKLDGQHQTLSGINSNVNGVLQDTSALVVKANGIDTKLDVAGGKIDTIAGGVTGIAGGVANNALKLDGALASLLRVESDITNLELELSISPETIVNLMNHSMRTEDISEKLDVLYGEVVYNIYRLKGGGISAIVRNQPEVNMGHMIPFKTWENETVYLTDIWAKMLAHYPHFSFERK